MDFILQAMTSAPRRGPPQGGNPPNQPRQQPYQGARSQTPPSSNANSYGGAPNNNFRPPQPPKPQPPPMAPPPVPPNNMRFPPPPNSRGSRQNEYQQSPERSYDRSDSRPQRGRPYPPRNNREPSPQPQHQDYQPNRREQYSQRPGQEQFNRNRRNPEHSNSRQNDYNDRGHQGNYNQREDHQNYRRPYNDNRESRQEGRPRDYKGEDRDQRQEERPTNRYDKRQPQNRNQYDNREQRDNRNTYGRQDQTAERGGQRGRPRGRDRGRGRGRGRSSPQKPAEIEKEESEEQSMEMEQSQAEAESEKSGKEQSGSASQAGDSVSAQAESQSEQAEESESQEQQVQSQQGSKMMSISESGSINIQRIDSMVSKEEFEERVETFRMNNRGGGLRLDTGRSFAIFEINKKTMQPDLVLTLKRFRRSTNRGENQAQNEQTADCPRSRKGLHATIKHIHKEIIDSDAMKSKDLAFPLPPGENKIQFLHIYDFLWNRMREMIKDVARLDLKERGTQEVVLMCQQMLRFFIIAIREGRQPHHCRLVLDSKMNLESITKILTQLLEIYEMAHYKMETSSSQCYISPNQPEILGYAILISNDLQRTLNEKLRVRLNGDGLSHPLLSSSEVEIALMIKKAIKIRDYSTFYKILSSQKIDYVQSCLMIHNLPTVRREVLRVLQKSCPSEKDTKIKAMPVSVLRKVLGFSVNLTSEFYQFLENVGIRTMDSNGQQMAVLNEINQSLQDFIESYAFDFGYNKKDRTNYPNSQIKNMVDPKSISREELIKRSWHQGNYLRLCSQYYNNEVGEPEEQQKKIEFAVRKEEVPKELAPKIPQKSEKGEEGLLRLLKMKKELQRGRFLQGLKKLITNLVKRSDVHSQHQRKRGIAMMIEFIELQKEAILRSSLQRLLEYSEHHKIAYLTIENLNRFAINKKKFMESYYKGSSELQEFNPQKNYRSLAEAVEPRAKIPQGLMSQLTSLAQNRSGHQSIKVLILFCSSSHSPLSPLHIRLLKNIYKYISSQSNSDFSRVDSQLESFCSQRSNKPFLDLFKTRKLIDGDLELKMRLFHYRGEQEEAPMLYGYDSIIFLDLHGSTKMFDKMIKELSQHRKKVMQEIMGQCSPLRTNVTTILVISMEKFKQKIVEGNLKEEQCSRWHLAQNEAARLSLPLRHNLLQSIANSLSQNRAERLQLEPVTVTSLLNQMHQNMQFVQNAHAATSSLDFFQKYFKANLNYLKKVLTKVVQQYEYYDWTQVLLESTYLRKSAEQSVLTTEEVLYPQQKINWNSLLSTKLLFSHQIISLLSSVDLPSRFNSIKRERPYVTTNQLLAAAVEQYLQLFQKEERPDSLQLICEYVIENNCSLTVRQNQIDGDARALVSYIMVQLKKQLKYLTIVLPKGFRFKLNKADLQSVRKGTEVKEGPSSLPSSLSRSKLEYQYEDLLGELMEELRTEVGEEFKNLRTQGSKAVKT